MPQAIVRGTIKLGGQTPQVRLSLGEKRTCKIAILYKIKWCLGALSEHSRKNQFFSLKLLDLHIRSTLLRVDVIKRNQYKESGISFEKWTIFCEHSSKTITKLIEHEDWHNTMIQNSFQKFQQICCAKGLDLLNRVDSLGQYRSIMEALCQQQWTKIQSHLRWDDQSRGRWLANNIRKHRLCDDAKLIACKDSNTMENTQSRDRYPS